MSHHGHHSSDKGAAYTGLIVSVIFILAVVAGVSKLTAARFASHDKPAAAGQTTGH